MRLLILELLLRLAARLIRDDDPLPELPPDHRGDVHRRAREKRKRMEER